MTESEGHSARIDDEESAEPYRNRSEKWTERYRKLIPYEKARISVMTMGFESKEDWLEYVADGKQFHGPYLPNHPDEMYADDWVSWEEFLGVMREYGDTRNIVQNVLRLQTREEYRDFVHEHPKRAEGLRIPAKPEIVYRHKGWINDDDFFGTMQ